MFCNLYFDIVKSNDTSIIFLNTFPDDDFLMNVAHGLQNVKFISNQKSSLIINVSITRYHIHMCFRRTEIYQF